MISVLMGILATMNTAIAVPIGYQLIPSSFQNTGTIGTTEHPTINGGMMNAIDHAPINQSVPVEVQPASHALQNIAPNENTPFQDNWATNTKVKQVLLNAASQGKLEYVLKKSEQMGLPSSVAIVPMVESQYQTQVISPKGAAGAWQLMPAVAKDYGISNQDRFQFPESTDTALQLLNNLHHQFNNWDLAFAAYNAGSKRITDALQKNPSAKNVNDLDIPQETKEYVRRIKNINDTLGGMSDS